MIPQLSQTEAKELHDLRLPTESLNQNSANSSFEKKLEQEKERLGLLFSPFSQLNSFFSSLPDFSFSSNGTYNDFLFSSQKETLKNQEGQNYNFKENQGNNSDNALKVQIFESSPFKTYFNRQMLQKLLSTTNWLAPNLQTSPLFFRASQEGTLQPKLDLQLLVDEIAKQVKLVKSKGQIDFSLTLNPEELGEIFLTLTSRSGMLSIGIQASAETKKLIDSRKEELKIALGKSNLSVSEIKIEEVKKDA